jgi:hypothetical protein
MTYRVGLCDEEKAKNETEVRDATINIHAKKEPDFFFVKL